MAGDRVTKTYSLQASTVAAVKKFSDKTNIPQSRILEMGIKMALAKLEKQYKEA